jgi:D-beta-D-heptose 7-phosphate kinase/D-beta-D-heptose 1-phosphate adenosyltransferase
MEQVAWHSQRPIELARSFRQLRVLVIGDVMLDTYLEGNATRLCSEGPVPVVRKTAEQRIPGGAANTAANLRALEADVALLGVVGHDIAGSLLREALQARGIDDHWLVEDEQASTLHKLRILADGQYVVRFDEGGLQGEQSSPYTKRTQQRLLAHLEYLYAWCDLMLISDYCYGVVFDALIELLQKLHDAQPKTWLIDSKALQRFRTVSATIVTPNYLEAQLLIASLERDADTSRRAGQRDSADMAEVAEIASRLLSSLHTEHVAITLAERGVFLLNRAGSAVHIPAHPVHHANDVGAGDSFSAALALALAAGAEIEEAARIAIDAAAIAVTKPRTAVVLYQELLQSVSLRAYAKDANTQRSNAEYAARTHLVSLLDAERSKGRIVVFTNGVFDILHAGHVQFLRQARALGDVLVVGINSDGSVRRRKGAGRPINSERDRCSLVAALDMVDHVLIFDEDTPSGLIRLLRPAIHVKGGDYADESLPEAEAVREVGGRIVILPLAGTVSTSDVIERIKDLTIEKQQGAV